MERSLFSERYCFVQVWICLMKNWRAALKHKKFIKPNFQKIAFPRWWQRWDHWPRESFQSWIGGFLVSVICGFCFVVVLIWLIVVLVNTFYFGKKGDKVAKNDNHNHDRFQFQIQLSQLSLFLILSTQVVQDADRPWWSQPCDWSYCLCWGAGRFHRNQILEIHISPFLFLVMGPIETDVRKLIFPK